MAQQLVVEEKSVHRNSISLERVVEHLFQVIEEEKAVQVLQVHAPNVGRVVFIHNHVALYFEAIGIDGVFQFGRYLLGNHGHGQGQRILIRVAKRTVLEYILP